MINKKIKQIAILAAEAGGKKLLREYRNFNRAKVSYKAHHEIVTAADLASEKEIIKTIKKNFPDHEILSEESGVGGVKSDYCWIIDPLDGTTNFSMHNPLFAVSIGVAFRGEVVVGVIYAPALGELFVAEKSKGAFLNGKKIKSSKLGKKGRTLNTYCHGREEKDIRLALAYMNYQKLHGFDCRQLGSAALELAYVASGRVESIVIPGAHPWDVAAGVILVREAGGRVTDLVNKAWNLKSYGIGASNGEVHSEIIGVLKKVQK